MDLSLLTGNRSFRAILPLTWENKFLNSSALLPHLSASRGSTLIFLLPLCSPPTPALVDMRTQEWKKRQLFGTYWCCSVWVAMRVALWASCRHYFSLMLGAWVVLCNKFGHSSRSTHILLVASGLRRCGQKCLPNHCLLGKVLAS